jgi:two-component system sensor histidine kinase TctE
MADAPRSLLARVVQAVLLLLLLGGVLISGSTWYNGRAAARQAYDRILLGAASDIAESISVRDGVPVADLPVSAFELLAQAPDDRVYYSVRGPDDGLIAGLDDTRIAPPDPARGIGPVYFDARLQHEAARFVQVKRRFAERDFSGEVSVIVGQTLRARRAMALGLVLQGLVPVSVAGIALLVMSYFIIRSAVRPLELLAADLLHRDPYDLTPMRTEGLPRELRVTLDAMNRFMDRLDRQMQAMRNLISDSAHQLRTPVAAIRVQAESMVDEEDAHLRAHALARLLARTRSLGRLLDQLLSRALVIHRTDSAPRVIIDLREIALDIVEKRDHELLAPGAEVTLAIGEAPVPVLADAFSLEQAGRNLLVNALKHGRAPVRIGTDDNGTEASLWVQDAGPGPDPALLARVGRRFARSAASHEDSAGLGLSIVSDVAAAFGGRVDMVPGPEGFRVSLVLPAVEAPK